MSLSFEQIETAFRARQFKPLYFLFGEEGYRTDQAQALLVEHALAPHERDFNLDVVYGPDAEGPEVVARCNAYPLMAERRVVLVRDFEKLRGNAVFSAYAERPNPSAVVVLACRTKPNLSQHPYRALKQHAAWAEFKALKPHEVAGFVAKRLETRGIRLDAAAAAMLTETLGTDLQAAATEADKLAAYAGTRDRLSADDVTAAAGQSREANVFELQKAVADGRYADAVRIGERLLRHATNARGEALRIVAVLTTYFTKLQTLAALTARRTPEGQMASAAGVAPFFLKEYLAALRRLGPRLDDAFAALLAADYELKGATSRDDRLVLLLLLRRLVPAAPGH